MHHSKLFFDIAHPFHFHVFRQIMEYFTSKGDDVYISARNKDINYELLRHYQLTFIERGKGGKSLFNKVWYFVKTVIILSKKCREIKPDVLISFSSPYFSLVSFFTGIPHIALDDTENDLLTWLVYSPFAYRIITPLSFPLRYSKKQVRFAGNFELAYLHPSVFAADESVKDRLGLKKNEKYVIVRFVSHSALHDLFQKSVAEEEKIHIVNTLKKYARVFISSEIALNKDLEQYRFTLPPSEMHSAMAFSSLIFGESATMTSEAAVLGVPAVFIDSKGRCYTKEEEEKYGLVFKFNPDNIGIENSLKKAAVLLDNSEVNDIWQEKRKKLLNDYTDVKEFIIHLIVKYLS